MKTFKDIIDNIGDVELKHYFWIANKKLSVTYNSYDGEITFRIGEDLEQAMEIKDLENIIRGLQGFVNFLKTKVN